MPPNAHHDASASAIRALEDEITQLTKALHAAEDKTRALRDAEDLSRGVHFAQEIFACQQEKLRLEVEIRFRRVKINKLKMGAPDDADGGSSLPSAFC